MKRKKVLLLGATGSIGKQTIDIINEFKEKFELVAITAYRDINGIFNILSNFDVKNIGIYSKSDALLIKEKFNNLNIFYGDNFLLDILDIDFDILVNAVVGFIGLRPSIKALKKGKLVALANKETLVTGGKYIQDLILNYKGKILPIDSEHSAIFQSISNQRKYLKNIILTASGGPFWKIPLDEFKKIKYEDVFNHPVWKMGKKITVDSATFANKGLEVIEAKYLFNILAENIKVFIHPQAIVHSGVEFIDGSFIFQMSKPDMRLPILYSLSYPERFNYKPSNPLNLAEIRQLEFFDVDLKKFKALKLAYECVKKERGYPIVFNAVNEVAVDLFIKKQLSFYKIPILIEEVLNKINIEKVDSLDSILYIDNKSRQLAYKEANLL